MTCKCNCSGTGNIESSNFWTQDWMSRKLKSEFPKLIFLTISHYQQHFSITLVAGKDENMKTKFDKSETDMMSVIKIALANAKIELLPNYIITRKVSIRKLKKDTIHFFFLLSDQFVKILKEKTCPPCPPAIDASEFKISSGFSKLYFKAIEPRVLEGFSCVKCPHSSCNYFHCCF